MTLVSSRDSVKCRRLRNSPYLLIFLSMTVLPKTLVSDLWEVLFFPGLAFPDGTSKYYLASPTPQNYISLTSIF